MQNTISAGGSGNSLQEVRKATLRAADFGFMSGLHMQKNGMVSRRMAALGGSSTSRIIMGWCVICLFASVRPNFRTMGNVRRTPANQLQEVRDQRQLVAPASAQRSNHPRGGWRRSNVWKENV
ncbi:unnamed protein product [Prorocentrum cordatum]|uniref:Uncharacterized protein n=1 Tax=Prorocentrum cordatum TaxID=2364126 RepID=A0ABN9U763_9DINO|nr:unnamed protein product [Polarella glacialis]